METRKRNGLRVEFVQFDILRNDKKEGKRPMLDHLAKLVTKRPRLIIFIAILLIIPSIWGYLATRVNYDVLSYLPASAESVKGQDELEDIFHNAATSMLIIEGLPERDVVNLSEKIRNIDGVSEVISVRDIAGIGIPKDFLPKEAKDMFYSDTGSMMMIKYEHASAAEQTMQCIDEIRALTEKQGYLSGISVILRDLRMLMDREMPWYVILAGILAFLAMTITLESWFVPFVFLISIFLAIIYNFGTNVFLGEISYVTKAIAAILQLGVTTDYAIFLIHRYEEEKKLHHDNAEAMESAVKNAFVSLSGSSVTTIAGFGALCFMGLTLGRDVGLVMMKGVMLGVLTIVTVLPAMILVLDKPIHKWVHKIYTPNVENLSRFILKRKKRSIIIFLILILPALYIQSQTEIYYNIDKSLPQNLPSNLANNKLKEDFDMSSIHFIVMKEEVSSADMKVMIDKLEKVWGVKKVIGYERFIGPAIPDFFIPQSVKDVFKKDGRQMLMIISECKAASEEANEQIDELSRIVKYYDETGLITGEAPLTKDLMSTVNRDITITNILSAISILFIIAIVFRSFSLPFILVGCIEFAIFVNMGIPYLTGTVIPFISPMVIGAIQLGATVDYAILLTSRYHEERKIGVLPQAAMERAIHTSAKSIFTSALVFFMVTLGVACISSMEMIKSICEMLARGAVISAAVILMMLPPLLMQCDEIIKATTLSWDKK